MKSELDSKLSEILGTALYDVHSRTEQDYKLLEKKLYDIFECTYTELNDGAISAIVECCLKTLELSDIFSRAYVNTTLERIIPELKTQLLKELLPQD